MINHNSIAKYQCVICQYPVMTDNGGRGENVKVWTTCIDWDETNISAGNTIDKKNHLGHPNNLSVQNELLLFSDSFKSLCGCFVQALAVLWAMHIIPRFTLHSSVLFSAEKEFNCKVSLLICRLGTTIYMITQLWTLWWWKEADILKPIRWSLGWFSLNIEKNMKRAQWVQWGGSWIKMKPVRGVCDIYQSFLLLRLRGRGGTAETLHMLKPFTVANSHTAG